MSALIVYQGALYKECDCAPHGPCALHLERQVHEMQLSTCLMPAEPKDLEHLSTDRSVDAAL